MFLKDVPLPSYPSSAVWRHSTLLLFVSVPQNERLHTGEHYLACKCFSETGFSVAQAALKLLIFLSLSAKITGLQPHTCQ